MTLRGAVIGCGRIGSTLADDPLLAGDVFTHAEAYVTSDQTDLVALCDSDEQRLAECGRRWGVTALFTDPGLMMREAAPEMVSVATPTPTHLNVVRQLLGGTNRPRMILCEKPLASTLADAEEIVRLSGANGVMLATIYMRRFANNIRALKAIIDSRELGSIQAISGWYIGGTFHNGTHWFDMLRHLAGEAEWVEALDSLEEGGPDPTLDVFIGLAGGQLATLRACRADRYTLFEMDIVFETGRALITDSGHGISLWQAAPSPRYTGYVELQPLDRELGDRRDLLLHAVEDAAVAVTLEREPACTAADGLRAMRIADAARRSGGSRVLLHNSR
jgi:predicted dehydrogenase